MTDSSNGDERAATRVHEGLTASAVTERARSLEQDALARLAEAAGNRSLCALSRDGSPHPAAKYHEGAVSALAAARRALAAVPADAGAAAAVDAVRERWLARHDRLPDTAAWKAYRAGGLDALEPLLRPQVDEQQREPWALGLADAVRLPGADGAAMAIASRADSLAPDPDDVRETAQPWPEELVVADDGSRSVLRRRAAVAAALWPVVLAVLVLARGGWTWELPWAVLVPLVALVGAATLSTYVPRPGTGRRLEIGCSPCAVVSGLTVVVAAWLLSASPHDPVAASGALVAVGFGLLQRLTKAGAACPV